MSRQLVFLLVFMTSVMQAMAQTFAPTTEEEYNYGAIGYRIQLQTRMTDKPGYEIRVGGSCEEPGRKITFNNMYRVGEKVPCALILVYERPGVSPSYYCVPSSNASPALWDKFKSSLNGGTDNPVEQLRFFATCMARGLLDDNLLKGEAK
ncbi:MAG: hypothetical protein ACKO0X_08310 [Bacteroidota bacterium]